MHAFPTADQLCALARRKLESGAGETAEELFSWAVELRPDLVAAHMGLGVARIRVGRWMEGIPALRRCVELAPESPEGHLSLAVALHLAGRMGEAGMVLRRALELDPGRRALDRPRGGSG